MATDTTRIPAPGRLSVQAQRNVVAFTTKVVEVHKRFTTLNDKMDAIDVAYARYKLSRNGTQMVDGIDVRAAADTACNIFAEDEVTPPVVVSQVDTHVGYLADVFLSHPPLFPVVSNPANMKDAEKLETLIDDHAMIGGYARQLLLFLRDAVKYNYSAIEADWTDIEQFTVLDAFDNTSGKKTGKTTKKFTRLKRLNPRNVLRDMTVNPGDVAEHGDYAGYVERVSRMKLKKELNSLTRDGKVYNPDHAINSAAASYGSITTSCIADDPQISQYVTRAQAAGQEVDWDAWLDNVPANRRPQSYGQTYDRLVLYARILPSEFGITAPASNTPQIWKFIVINGRFMISAERIVSAYEYLPILFGQPLEDGLGYQTQSIGEGEIPFQQAAATLFNIKFAASRRAVSDRALYDSEALDPKHVNSPTAAPKIPARISALSTKKLGDLYHQIPFDMRGVENTIQDAQIILNFSKELHGSNGPRTGQFQKGNKSVTEWEDTMGNSDNRMRLPALVLEYQVFSPLRSLIVLNIYQYGDNVMVVSQKTGEVLEIDIADLRKKVLSFRVGDGYTPKSKLASIPMLTTGLQMISTNQLLAAQYGSSLPGIFAHLMSLGGVKGLEEYDPKFQAAKAQQEQQGQQNPLGPQQSTPSAENALINQSPTQGNTP